MIVDERYKLNNGQRIPKVALGTWQVSDDEAEAVVAVRTTRQGAREAADVRIAGRVAVTTRRVTARKGDFAVLLQLAEEAADTVGAMGARDRVTVEDEGTATMPACHIADEASDAVGGG